MDNSQSLNHSRWACKYPVVFIRKCRRKALYKELRPHLGAVFRSLTKRKECQVEEGRLMPDGAHAAERAAEVCGVAGGGLHRGQECDSSGADVW